jgi:putative ABC transport system substrate-binding protein
MIGRRALIGLLGGAGAAALEPGLAWAQAGKPATIGFLGTGSAAGWQPWTAVFEQRLQELGWIEGRTVAIEYRWGEGNRERFAEFADDLVRRKVDIIVTGGSAVASVKQATTVIPVVFVLATDPIGGGLIASLSRPGGNVTGSSNQGIDLAGKRLELLREVVPGLRRLAVLANANYPDSVAEMSEVGSAAGRLGLDVTRLEIRQARDIAPAFATLGAQAGTQAGTQASALYVAVDGLVAANRTRIFILAAGARLPTIVNAREHAEAGALMSYGPSFPALFRRAAEYVDRILRGAKPADLPVEQPTKYDLVVNLVTAKAIGLEVPPTLLARADEVIE